MNITTVLFITVKKKKFKQLYYWNNYILYNNMLKIFCLTKHKIFKITFNIDFEYEHY